MKKTLAVSFIFLISTSLLAQETKKIKKNKISLGNIKINANAGDDLFQLSDKFTITDDGKVGIGTSAPEVILDVKGAANIDGAIKAAGPVSSGGPITASGPITSNGAITANGPLEIKGSIKISGSKSGFITLITPNDAGSATYTLPSTDGETGEFLTTNGTGTLSWTTIHPYRTSCPAGFTLVGTPDTSEVFCISSNQEAAGTWLKAIANCYSKSVKARLCSASEWAMSCVSDSPKKMTGHWEWVADSGSNYGRIIGLGGCDSFNGANVETTYASRCCFR